MKAEDVLRDLPKDLSVEALVRWLVEHAPEILEKLLPHFRAAPPAAETLKGEGHADAELKRRGTA